MRYETLAPERERRQTAGARRRHDGRGARACRRRRCGVSRREDGTAERRPRRYDAEWKQVEVGEARDTGNGEIHFFFVVSY